MYDADGTWLRKWMRAIEAEAARHSAAWSKQIPVIVKMSFVMPATAKHHVGWCAVAPDIDKLERAVLDALHTGKHKVYVSDAQVVQTISAKRWGHKPGVWITVADAGPAYDLRTTVTVDQTGVTTP
jgi:Holliday junction resolvase RusA-like endonuclease